MESAINNKMSFVPDRLTLPLFLLTRSSIRSELPGKYGPYLNKKCSSYVSKCEKGAQTATKEYFKHIAGFDESKMSKFCKAAGTATAKRILTATKTWQLPPNIYNITEKADKPCYGALWKKLPSKPKKPRKSSDYKFYNIPSFVDNLLSKSNQYKGVFLTNPRERRPTTRSMITNPLTCYRDPEMPGPASYTPFPRKYICGKVIRRVFDAVTYYPQTTVPIKTMSIHTKHTSFLPGPGRYDSRFRHFCPCSSKLKYSPDIQDEIEKQKRLKFRRLPYKKIKPDIYYTPEWRHVKGHGFRHLFKGGPVLQPSKKIIPRTKTKYKRIQLYADGRYIKMITDPKRDYRMVFRKEYTPLVKPIHFNTIIKPKPRKQLRVNKKVAFGSSEERFKDGERQTSPFTVTQLAYLISTLPEDRQFKDHPVMRIASKDIKTNLYEVPKRLAPTCKLQKTKKQLRLSPLPEPKILINVEELDVAGPGSKKGECRGVISIKTDPLDYFRADLEPEVIEHYKSLLKRLKK
ncbi:uncharacterized protein LOC119685574 [Teleopsis dalmanni]|uniref:uncharacterized protein LOC119685574 n=1 Tax=Teleopsis dalmanni TaxID=139649 RepID=UPI0018CC7CCA|nr:uncharacterized protein LOC119685574 [Teleopsis dalmanni]